jgi:serine/threonine-protein kinase SRPK3
MGTVVYRLARNVCIFLSCNWPKLIYPLSRSDASGDTKKYYAVKLLTAQATARIVMKYSPEFEVYKKIGSANTSHPGFQHCLVLKNHFLAYSAAGGHISFVTDPLGSNLQSLRPAGRETFSVPAVKRVMKQLLLALDYLHHECGYIHTGKSV